MTTTVCLTFDFDALSLWIGTLRQTSPTPLSRGEYGARVGIPRILELLGRHGIKATFFVPGHTALTFPRSVRAIAEAGHEIGAHNLVHETPVGLERSQEAMIIEAARAALQEVAGVNPVGYRSPAWDMSPSTIALLVEHGYLYDSSMMADDFTPYRPQFFDRIGDAGEVTFGEEAPIWEFPVAWELDDFPYFHFSHKVSGRGLRSPEEVGEIWLMEFEYCHRHVSNGVFTLTTHPQIIGRGPRLAMLDRLIVAMRSRADVRFATMADAARQLQQTQETKR